MSNSTLVQSFLFSQPLLLQLYIFPGCEWLQHAQFSCSSSYNHFFYFGPVFLTGSEWFYMGPSCVFSDIHSTNLFLLAWQRVSMPADSTVFALVICPLTWCILAWQRVSGFMQIWPCLFLWSFLTAWSCWIDRMWVILYGVRQWLSHSLSAHSGPIALTESKWFYATRSSNVSSQHSFTHSDLNGFIVG